MNFLEDIFNIMGDFGDMISGESSVLGAQKQEFKTQELAQEYNLLRNKNATADKALSVLQRNLATASVSGFSLASPSFAAIQTGVINKAFRSRYADELALQEGAAAYKEKVYSATEGARAQGISFLEQIGLMAFAA